MNPPDSLTGPFTLPDVTLVQPAESATPHRELHVRGDRIATADQGGGRVLDQYRGAYVVPGLVDMHTHLPPRSPLHLTESVLLLHIAHGVTTVRDAGDADGSSGAAARDAIERGHPGPRLSTAGSFVTRGRTRWPNSVQMAGPARPPRSWRGRPTPGIAGSSRTRVSTPPTSPPWCPRPSGAAWE
ncbi:amidohydrolase family protein [Streptomyces olivochromogenes]|uniref:amidohydrolase family protein n=1 Tax=Streptomyces olivochromogenes TaxID=1963 RepID=UPI001F29A833|nr:amidohydrolase family protein [Streptomyces olivochromogenes]MCF3131398.1 amidohydrolase family protein [Streptomyces olivochromogenes]